MAEEIVRAVDGPVLAHWARLSVKGLESRCDEINALNVFPIPDADTGTNMLFTIRAAVAALDDLVGDISDVRRVTSTLAQGALAGARGNSGAILSQVLRGVAESPVHERFDTAALRAALELGTKLVSGAVSYLVEGTIVTVLRCAADAVAECSDDVAIADSVGLAADAAAAALARTPMQLDILGEAGVVDAGGLGLVIILDSLVTVITGEQPQRSQNQFAPPTRAASPVTSGAFGAADCADHSVQDFEVMYLVDRTDEERIGRLRASLNDLGDSVVIVSDGSGKWSVHVHCADAGAAVEAGVSAGRLHDIRISCFLIDARDQLHAARAAFGPETRGILAVVAGDAAADLFESEGATVLRSDTELTRAQLLTAIRDMARREVLVLPNGALPAQELVAVTAEARDAHHQVVLLATSSMVQGLASLAVHDPTRTTVDDSFTMSEAAAATRWGSLRIAQERALTYVGTCEPGDAIGLMGQEVIVIEPGVVEAGRRLIDLVLGAGGELVTLLIGAQAPEGLGEALSEHIAQRHPGVDVMIYQGGQDGDLLQLGIE